MTAPAWLRRLAAPAVVVAWLMGATVPAPPVPDATTLDDFATLDHWSPFASDDVLAHIAPATAGDTHALRLRYNFRGHGGYAIARRALSLDLPGNFEFTFDLRGDSPANDFQFKLVDASGENVWWYRRADFDFPKDRRTVKVRRRQIDFAWGPTDDRSLKSIAAIEFVVSAGSGGAGFIEISNLKFRALPLIASVVSVPTARASATTTGSDSMAAIDGDESTAWRAPAGSAVDFTIDLGAVRELGGLTLAWLAGHAATDYDVELSDDGVQWSLARTVRNAGDIRQAVLLSDAEARFVRLQLLHGPPAGLALAECTVEPLAFGASPNDFFMHVAEGTRRGDYPRAYAHEQSYWTVVGTDGGSEEGLLSEDGAFELRKAAPSLEPFVTVDGRVHSWADVAIGQSLRDRYLPMPAVHWTSDSWKFEISAFAADESGHDYAIVRYKYSNESRRTQKVSIAVAVRPLQVNPPTQFLNGAGGVTPVRKLEWSGDALSINQTLRLLPLDPPDAVTGATFDSAVAAHAVLERATPLTRLDDDFGYASAVLLYGRSVPAHRSASMAMLVPWGDLPDTLVQKLRNSAGVDRLEKRTADKWHAKLDRVVLSGPKEALPVFDTVRTALAHILINRDGPGLQPGSRSYERSWIRDGALESEALLRLGQADVARAFLDWYATYQFSSGKVPCCVDRRGADPVAENDSAGEFLWLMAEVYRYTGDTAALQRAWPQAKAALQYLDSMRQSERTPANLEPERRHFYGLLPPSISHEGYSAKPMHSYWDDFWALAGFESGVRMARALQLADEIGPLSEERDQFRSELHASIARAVAHHRIEFIPGAADLGDFDATSTTIALSPVGDLDGLPRPLVDSTFERYWREFSARRDGKSGSTAYTPYEIRTIGSFVRLGWRTRANALLAYFMHDRRPAAWNQWAEVVGLNPREPRFIGDMPHTWVASDYIRSVTDLFAFERESDRTLVLAAGIDPGWLEGAGIAVRDLRTPWGALSYTLKRAGPSVRLKLARGVTPPGGIVLRLGTTEHRFAQAPVDVALPWPRAD